MRNIIGTKHVERAMELLSNEEGIARAFDDLLASNPAAAALWKCRSSQSWNEPTATKALAILLGARFEDAAETLALLAGEVAISTLPDQTVTAGTATGRDDVGRGQ